MLLIIREWWVVADAPLIPFAPGAHGNIATEDLVAHPHARDITTGIDEGALTDAVTLIRDMATPLP
jgi:hypothetical protein